MSFLSSLMEHINRQKLIVEVCMNLFSYNWTKVSFRICSHIDFKGFGTLCKFTFPKNNINNLLRHVYLDQLIFNSQKTAVFATLFYEKESKS